MNWQLKPKPPQNFIKKFPEYPFFILSLLYNRELRAQKAIDEFFNPDYGQDLHSPFLLKNIKPVLGRIKKALKSQEKILIYGDFDCDGICATLILEETLKKIGAKHLSVYIPNQEKENHGLNIGSVKYLKSQKIDLVLVVDCGMTDYDEVKLARRLGIEVVIIDHHQIPQKMPRALILNPWQKGDKYPFKNLCGTGLVFKVVQALQKEHSAVLSNAFEKWQLDLVALATIADMMPLLGENRTLVKYGLIVLAQTQRPGLKILLKKAGIIPFLNREELLTNIGTETINYVLVPRLNVASRMDHASIAYKLLKAATEKEARDLADVLEALNQKRQKLVQDIVLEIEKELEGKPELLNSPFIFKTGEWPVGLNGIIAVRVSEKFQKPAFILNQQKGTGKNGAEYRFSFRSQKSDLNVIEFLKGAKKILIDFGGHAQAAGGTILGKDLRTFKNYLKNKFSKRSPEGRKDQKFSNKKTLEIDLEVDFTFINWDNSNWLKKLEPFGQKNSTPLFLLRNLEIAQIKKIGRLSNHLKLLLSPYGRSFRKAGGGEKTFKALAFNQAAQEKTLKPGDKIDIVFNFLIDEWNGRQELNLKIIDLEKSAGI